MGYDDVRVHFSHHIYADAPFVQGTGFEVFNHYVSMFYHFQEQLLAFFKVEVQGNALFVTTHGRPADALAILQRSHISEGIAPAGHFYLNNFCAEVGQDACCKRCCNDRCDIQHSYPC